jgi:hypothetical protein
MVQNRINWRIFGSLLSTGVAIVLGLSAPLWIGVLLGHAWGAVAGIGSLFFWFYLCIKQPMAHSTRMVWLVCLVYIVFFIVVEYMHIKT